VATSPTLVTERPADGVAMLRLARPDRLNAIDQGLRDALLSTLAELGEDSGVGAVVLTGTGRGFCAGLDLRGFGPDAPDPRGPAAALLRFQESMAALPEAVRALPQPVIAAVNGPAVGAGLSLCLASDIRIAGPSASFGNAAILIGLSGAELGMSYFLPRLVGAGVAADWMLSGRTVSADEAHARGLVSQLVDDADLLPEAIALASTIAAHSALAVRMTKRALQVNTDAPDLTGALELENRNQVITAASDEAAAARARWSRPPGAQRSTS
jgi:enoyl-CoA hydratase/carnithine racemase